MLSLEERLTRLEEVFLSNGGGTSLFEIFLKK